MSARLAALLRNDIRQQLRFSIYAVYAVLCLGYAVGLSLLPAALRPPALVLVLFSDPAALGFFFVGGLLLLERNEGTLMALASSPARSGEIIAAKVVSLTLLAVGTSVVLVVVLGAPARWPLLLAALALTSAFNTLFGIAVAARAQTINQYFARAIAVSIPLLGPLALLAWRPESPWLSAYPTTASARPRSGPPPCTPVEPWHCCAPPRATWRATRCCGSAWPRRCCFRSWRALPCRWLRSALGPGWIWARTAPTCCRSSGS